jgi:hypothetical protein
MSESPRPTPDGETGGAERLVAGASLVVTAAVVLTVFGTYVYGANTSPHHVTEGSVALQASPSEVVALLQDMERRPSWRPDVARIARKSDPTDRREVWRELDHEDDRFDFEVVARPTDGLTIRTEAAEQIGYEATWTFRVTPAGSGSKLALVEEGFVDNPLFRGVFWLRGGPEDTVRDELVWLGLALDGVAPTLSELTVTER